MVEQLGWDEVARRATEHPEHLELPPMRDAPYTPDELLEEIEAVIDDTARFHRERPERGEWAFSPAQLAAGLRDRERPLSDQGSLGRLASLVGGWLLGRASRDRFEQTLEAARLAVVGDRREAALARELREFVAGYLGGGMTPGEFAAELGRGVGGGGPRAPHAGGRRAASAGGVLLDRAAGELERLLDGATAPEEVWRRFKRFAAISIAPTPPQWLSDDDGDLLLFEWGIYEAEWFGGRGLAFVAGFTRQFAVEGGEQPGLVQIGCELAARPDQPLRALEAGEIWSGEDRDAWFAEVERSDAFERLTAAGVVVLGVHVEHDDV
jgi:hypothetical protein